MMMLIEQVILGPWAPKWVREMAGPAAGVPDLTLGCFHLEGLYAPREQYMCTRILVHRLSTLEPNGEPARIWSNLYLHETTPYFWHSTPSQRMKHIFESD